MRKNASLFSTPPTYQTPPLPGVYDVIYGKSEKQSVNQSSLLFIWFWRKRWQERGFKREMNVNVFFLRKERDGYWNRREWVLDDLAGV